MEVTLMINNLFYATGKFPIDFGDESAQNNNSRVTYSASMSNRLKI